MMTIKDLDECTKIAKEIKMHLETIDKHELAMMFVRGYWYCVDEGDKQLADKALSSFIEQESYALFWDALYLILQEYHKRELIMPAKLVDWNVKNLDKKRKLPRNTAFNTIRYFSMYKAVEECIAKEHQPIYSDNGGPSICEGVALAWPKESDKLKSKTLGGRIVYDQWIIHRSLIESN